MPHDFPGLGVDFGGALVDAPQRKAADMAVAVDQLPSGAAHPVGRLRNARQIIAAVRTIAAARQIDEGRDIIPVIEIEAMPIPPDSLAAVAQIKGNGSARRCPGAFFELDVADDLAPRRNRSE